METIIGNKFINNKQEEITFSQLETCKLICLFFTASWCNPCELFSKQLLELYEEANQGEKLLEIISVTFEKNEQDFKANITNKPWLFLPYGNSKINELKNNYNILDIPIFYVMDLNGNIIVDDARKEICENGPMIVDEWLNRV
jgi:nucleoredoxin